MKEREGFKKKYVVEIKKPGMQMGKELFADGFRYDKNKKSFFHDSLSEERINYWRSRCRFRCRILIYEQKHQRGTRYREDHFLVHAPDLFGKYRCVYCGKLMTKKEATVDHLIPVQGAKRSRFWQLILERLKYDGVNDPRNLVTACKKCNSSKGSKTGIWILFGWLGKHTLYWFLVYGIQISLVVCLLVSIINHYG